MFGVIWDRLLVEPILNAMVFFYAYLGNSFVLSITLLTIAIRAITWPLMQQQLKSSKAMQQLQPQLQAIQKKYGKDREKLTQETMKLYKEAGVNPAAGCLPLLIQMPLLIAFYQAIQLLLGATPESLLDLARHLYVSIPLIAEIAQQAIPLESRFLWLNLAHPDPYYIMAILVGGTTWVQQKMSALPSADPQQAAMTQSMQLMMPLLFGFMTLQFPSGLAIYWIVSTLVSIAAQYFTSGWGGLLPQKADAVATTGTDKKAYGSKKSRGQRQKRG